MSFSKRREFVFLYTVKDANPNGNPLEENHPRWDEDTEQALVSDVRVKRTIRDEWVREGQFVFVDGEPKTLRKRFDELKKQTGKKTGREVMGECIDTKLFGVTFALGDESFSWSGPVQLKWGRSLNACHFEFIQGTSAFATEGRGGSEKQQRSFRNEYKVPFALIGVYGIANQNAALTTGASEEDLDDLAVAIWNGTDNLITRSKHEHKACYYFEIQYKEGFNGKIGALDEKLLLLSSTGKEMNRDAQKALRNLGQLVVDINPLVKAIEKKQEYIEKVRVVKDAELQLKGEEELKRFSFVEQEMR
ncbi:MAG TPA: type I-B CRISPR-associated protein Cas7/Csh2 [Syntrophomonadaceae bacterium]|nr:type I-B CRISPR-associated protein Cas7/Csh2 [Syntrophomonadaceae bacterium]